MKEQRRFPRIQVSPKLAALAGDLQAQVAWPNHEVSEVADLGYKGVAVRKPGLYPVNAQSSADVEVTLGGWPSFRARVRIAWCNMDWVGLEFTEIPAAGHSALAGYLDAKLVGSMMRPVERALISPLTDFQYWYQGPAQTHVYVWMSGSAVERVRVDMDGQVAEFVLGQPGLRLRPVERRALLVLSQMDKEGLPMEEFVRKLLTGA
jgi:hypothetical protein